MTLHHVLMTLPSSLLFLDNFETPWDQESSRSGVEEILSKIGASLWSWRLALKSYPVISHGHMKQKFHLCHRKPLDKPISLSIVHKGIWTVIVWRPSTNYSKSWIMFLWQFACSWLLAGVFRLHIFWGNGGKSVPNFWSWERTGRVASLSPSPPRYHNWRLPITQKHSTFLVYYPSGWIVELDGSHITNRSWIHQSPPLGSRTLADIAMFSTGRNIEGSISNSALYSFT